MRRLAAMILPVTLSCVAAADGGDYAEPSGEEPARLEREASRWIQDLGERP